MPYVKPAAHLGRIAGTYIKSFTHGGVGTVVAASQYLPDAKNTTSGSLADTLAGRYRKTAERQRLYNQDVAEGRRQASTATAPSGSRPETSHQDGLDKYFDAWQKHQRSGTKEWQQFQFAKRIEWQPPSTVPSAARDSGASAEAEELVQEKNTDLSTPSLKRSYTTSALDNFGKAFINDEAAEAAALEQVNISIAEEILRSKEADLEEDEGLTLKAKSSDGSSLASEVHTVSTAATAYTPTDSFSSTSEIDALDFKLTQLIESKQHAEIPAVFQSILHAGVQKPSPIAYRALLTSAIELTTGKHAKVPRALEVYSDMLRRTVTPDAETFGLLINLLAQRASQCLSLETSLQERRVRYGGLQAPGKFMFRSSQSEHAMVVEDSSLAIALKLFDQAAATSTVSLSGHACAALIAACAERGRLDETMRIHSYMRCSGLEPQSNVYPPMIAAFGANGDLRTAVELYDEYKDLAVAHNSGENDMLRVDNGIYAALIKAYGSAARLKGGLKFLASVQSEITNVKELEELREIVALDALLPLALQDPSFQNAFDLTRSLSTYASTAALARISVKAADDNKLDISLQAFESLSQRTKDLSIPAVAIMAMHIRNANVEAAEPFFHIIETAPASLSFIEPTTMRAIALLSTGHIEGALRPTRRLFGRIRDAQPESLQEETAAQIDEAIDLVGVHMLKHPQLIDVQPSAGIEVLRMMTENGGLVAPMAEHIMSRFGAEHIASLAPADLEMLLRIQGGMILDDAAAADIAGPARFGCLLENVISKSVMPAPETEDLIERTLVNVDRAELSRLWNSYRYPPTPATLALSSFSPIIPYQAPPAPFVQPAFEESYDPYASRTDVKGSNAINELLERSTQGRGRMNDALTKFRNMRRIGRVPRMFTYGKLIEAAAKSNDLGMAHDILEMAKQDVPLDTRYRVVRFGWQQILDHMVAGCLTVGRRDLAARYHQDLVDMGAAPSANTFGLYITTLKENTKTFDEASEAVKIFLRAKSEGVEPSSFLYNALIGKLGKARRIDDCLYYFAEMRNLGIRPTSVTYGTIVNALCRVSDEKFAEEIFEEMEGCSNYKPRPAPYHSLMQFFLTTKRDRGKVLAYYERMRNKGIEPTVHTFKLLIDTHATLEPVNMPAAEAVLQEMRTAGVEADAVHYAALIHAKGCVLHDMEGARQLFDRVISERKVRPQPCMYQALFESLNANRMLSSSAASLLADMQQRGVEFTPYIANALIHGWTLEKNIDNATRAFERVVMSKREPSTYEAMVRAYLAAEQREEAKKVVREALSRGYPSAVAGKIAELVR